MKVKVVNSTTCSDIHHLVFTVHDAHLHGVVKDTDTPDQSCAIKACT